MPNNIDKTFVDELFNGSRRIVSRAISIVEEGNSNSVKLLKDIHKKIGAAYRIGITGPPGAGKSTLTSQLTKYYRAKGHKVGIIAVDPTSPFSGGAILGDRIRMNEVVKDEGVFIRSMATRGSLGGLSRKTVDAGDVLDAAGYDIIIYETVGVGQSELDIAKAADTTVVAIVPESGDAIQAMKSGLMEIADIYVVNKSDRPGADSTLMALKSMLMFKDHNAESWLPGIIQTVATENKGVEDLITEIERHKNYLTEHNQLNKKREENSKIRIKKIVESILSDELWNEMRENKLDELISDVIAGKVSPYNIAENMILNFKKQK